MNRFIIQVRFTKQAHACFLSHRELMTVMERAVRRANIPIKFSEGFNPRPRISFPTALGLGIQSDDEVIYLLLSEWLSPNEILQRLQMQLIPGIEITSVDPIISKERPRILGIEYQISFTSPDDTPCEEDIQHLMSQPEILIQRMRKNRIQTKDIKKFITKIKRLDNQTLFLSVRYTPEGSASPDEVISALGEPPPDGRAGALGGKELGLKEGLANGKFSVRKTKTILIDK